MPRVGIVPPVHQHLAGTESCRQRPCACPSWSPWTSWRAGRADMGAHRCRSRMHPVQVRPFDGDGRWQALPASGLAPVATDAVPVTEAGQQIEPRDVCAHNVQDSVQERRRSSGRPTTGILAQQAVQGLACIVAQLAVSHGRRRLKRSVRYGRDDGPPVHRVSDFLRQALREKGLGLNKMPRARSLLGCLSVIL